MTTGIPCIEVLVLGPWSDPVASANCAASETPPKAITGR